MTRQTVLQSLQFIQDAFNRARKGIKKGGKDDPFSEEFWKTLGKRMKELGDASDPLSKMYGKQNDALNEYTRRLKEWRTQLAQATKDARTTAVENLKQMYIQMEQTNRQEFGQLFQGPWLTSETFDIAKEWGIQPRVQDLIKDLRQQNNVFAKWRRSLDAIFKKGLPRGFVDSSDGAGSWTAHSR
jgi:hypothetical protein